MPVVILTESQLKERRLCSQSRRVGRIIRTLSLIQGYTTEKLALKLGLSKSALNAKIAGARPFKLDELLMIADTLGMDDETRAALLGGSKCRWEV